MPNIRQSEDYSVEPIPFQPYAWTTGGTELTVLFTDDIYSSVISLPFPVCFFGVSYNSLVVGSNGLVAFDVSNAGRSQNLRRTAPETS